MTTKPRYAIALALLVMLWVSLACTLGGGDSTPAPTATALARITPSPSTGVPPTSATAITDTPPAATDTPSVPTETPTPSPTTIVGSGPGGCVLKGTYIADVTIPDGTLLAPNAPFVKTWRIRNDGTCAWDAGYQLVYASGNQMRGLAAVNIPSAATGQTIDISVNLVAPGTPGDYNGTWRLRASNGAIFGGYTVVIKVAGTPTPTTTPTRTATPVGGGAWGGTWETNFGVMALVQAGSSVTGFYNNGAGQINGTVNGNLLSGTYVEGSTTGSFDFWLEGAGQRWHGNYDKTGAWCGHRPGQADLSPCGVSTWHGTWITNCQSTVPCGDMVLTQVGDTVNGTYAGASGSVSGTVNGVVFSGTWRRNPGSPTEVSGSFKFTMVPDGTQFQGNYNGVSYWCGHRGGASDPTECFKN